VSDVILRVDGRVVHCAIANNGARYRVRLDGRDHDLDLLPLSPGLTTIIASGRRSLARVARFDGRWYVHIDGVTVECQIVSRDQGQPLRGRPSDEGLAAPMPGVVTQVLVREGDAVSPGQPLVIVEAMKMEHVVRARRAGRVRALRVRTDDQVEAGTVVLDLDAEAQEGEP
jgi:acetyl/propionyl-CoA carboxylase alpha subunit